MRIYRHLTANAVHLEPFPFKRELTMEAYLSENEGVLALDDVFSDVELIDIEIAVPNGRLSKNTDGRIDMLLIYSQEFIGVAELKHGELTEECLEQLQDYLNDSCRADVLERYKEELGESLSANPKWVGVLVGSAINSQLAARLHAGYAYQSIPIAALIIQRFRGSDGSVFVTTDLHFQRPRSSKDYTKYVFEGLRLSKNRLVLEVVKHFVKSTPDVTFRKLEETFQKKLQGRLGVFMTWEGANRLYAEKGFKRHFLKPEDLIQLRDADIAVCNQWGVGNIDKFINEVKNKLKYEIRRADD